MQQITSSEQLAHKTRVLVGAIFTFLVFLFYGYIFYSNEKREIISLNESLTDTYSIYLEQMIKGFDILLTNAPVGFLEGGDTQKASVRQIIQGRKKSEPALLNFVILSLDGELLYSADLSPLPSKDDDGCFSLHARDMQSGLFFSEPQKVIQNGKEVWYFVISRAVIGKSGKVVGYSFAMLSVDELVAKFDKLPLKNLGAIALLSKSGKFIARSPADKDLIGKESSAISLVKMPLRKSVSVKIPTALDGSTRYATLKPVGDYGLIIASTIKSEVMLIKLVPTFLTLLFVWIFVVVVIFFISLRLRAFQLSKEKERLAQAEEIKKSEERFRFAADHTKQIIFDHIVSKKRLLWSGACLEITGVSCEELNARSFTAMIDVVHKPDQERLLAAFAKARKEKKRASLEYKIEKPDGTLVDVEVQAAYLDDNRLIGAISDITKYRESERLLRSFNEELEKKVEEELKKRESLEQTKKTQEKLLLQQSKMAAMGEMIGAIAHQWRQPLSSLGLFIQDIEDAFVHGDLDKEYLHDNVQKAMKQIKFMSNTINDFKNFFKPDKIEKEFLLAGVLENTLNLLSAQIKNYNITIEYYGTDKDLVAIGFENELGQALLNIVNNAKDALIENKILEPNILIRLHSEGDLAVVEIEDNAGGIPAELIDRVFEPYFSTKDQGKGTGIGLYMAKMIIENNMAGKLSVINAENGAKFTIKLPCKGC